jgi:hypothetical protein
MTSKINLIEKLNNKYPKNVFTYDNVFFNYKCNILNECELKEVNQANKEIKISIVNYIKETQKDINEYLKELKECHDPISYENIHELSNSNISKLYFENNIHLFPELTLNAVSY